MSEMARCVNQHTLEAQSRRERQDYYLDPRNLAAFSHDLLGVELYPNQLEWDALANEHVHLLIEAAVGHGKSTWLYPRVTQQIVRSKTYQTWDRFLFCTKKERLARDYTNRIKTALCNPNITDLFGHFHDPTMVWDSLEFRIAGQPSHIKEPTFRAAGLGSGIEGTRANYGYLDDPIDLDNALSEAEREHAYEWFTLTFFARLDEGARTVVIGSSWHPSDLYAKMRAMPGWASYQYPCYRTPPYPWGELLCAPLWSREGLEDKRAAIGTTRFRLRYLMDNRAMTGGFFKEAWMSTIDRCPLALDKKGKATVPLEENGGWDFARTSKEIADKHKTDPDFTAGVSICFDPEGHLVITDIFHERITHGYEAPIYEMWMRRNQRSTAVETNSFQQLIKYALQEKHPEVPVVGVDNYSQDKASRILALQPYLERGFFVLSTIPRDTRAAFLEEYLTFPHGDHDDILDALQIAISNLRRNQTQLLPEELMEWI